MEDRLREAKKINLKNWMDNAFKTPSQFEACQFLGDSPHTLDIVKELFKERGLDEHGNKATIQIEGIKKAINEFYDKRDLAKKVLQEQPFYYDEARIWWYWDFNLTCWRQTDETNILNTISLISIANTISSKDKTEILEALRQESRLNKPKPLKKEWLQFKDEIYDLTNGETFKATPKYFAVNPIPYPLSKDKFMDTPTMDKIFNEWVGDSHVKTLYEIIAYCMLPDYPIHRVFCFIGSGLNGKSCYLNLIKKVIGVENICSTELDTLLTSRFEKTRLHKKLACIMGETNFNEIKRSNVLKNLTGQDLIGFEYKNKNLFDEVNYAKILIATNNLPETNDKSIGFYRRWMIIDFPNQFNETIDILDTIPEEEYEALTLRCVNILADLLKERKFTNEGSIEERTKRYEDKSNPMGLFIKEFCNTNNPDGFIYSFDFEKRFNAWCKENRYRHFSEETISKKLKDLGFEKGRKTTSWLIDGQYKSLRCWLGIEWKEKNDKE